jgi:hypothetical protein
VACRCLLELHAIAAKKVEGGGEFEVAMTAAERFRFLRCCKADMDEYYTMLSTLNVDAGVFFDSYNLGIREDFKQYYKLSGTVCALATQCHTSDDCEDDNDKYGSFNFGSPSKMVADLFKEWSEGLLRERILTCQESGQHSEAMQWNEMLMQVLSERHAAVPSHFFSSSAADVDSS